mgnify:CR=1 FL=1
MIADWPGFYPGAIKHERNMCIVGRITQLPLAQSGRSPVAGADLFRFNEALTEEMRDRHLGPHRALVRRAAQGFPQIEQLVRRDIEPRLQCATVISQPQTDFEYGRAFQSTSCCLANAPRMPAISSGVTRKSAYSVV